MILTVTPNVAVDRTASVDSLGFDRVLRPEELVVLPGGKGINVARAAHTLGAEVTTTGIVGDSIGDWFIAALEDEGLAPRFVTDQHEPRTTYVVVDRHAKTLLLYEQGAAASVEAQVALVGLLTDELIPGSDQIVISGSLPPGWEPASLTGIVDACHRQRRPCLVDTSGAALRTVLDAHPDVVKVSATEAREAGFDGTGPAELAACLVRAGATVGAVTDGAAGAAATDGRRCYEARPPMVDALCPVGSGDAFAAGLVVSLAAGDGLDEALRTATAAGAANTLRLGAGRLHRSDHERLLAEVRVTAS